MLVGFTFTTEIFLASLSLACSCLRSSLVNRALRKRIREVSGILKNNQWRYGEGASKHYDFSSFSVHYGKGTETLKLCTFYTFFFFFLVDYSISHSQKQDFNH